MLIPSGYAQCNWKFTGAAAPNGAECTMAFDVSSFSDTPANLATALGAIWNDNLLDRQTTHITLASVLVKFGPNDTGPAAEVGIGAAGRDPGSAFAPNTSVLVQKNTAMGGRAGRGRMYVPGVIEALFNESGEMSGASAETWNLALEAFHDDLTVGDFEPVLLHGVDAPISTPTPITSFTVSQLAATQRRRLRR